MKKRKGKTKRWLAGILSAVLVIGSINIVDALEGSNGESALYDAPELTITQGATDYDLMKDITYDSSMYELAVVNDGGFDVNTVGDYEVTYSLTSKDDGTLEPGDSGDASNSDDENKDQNSGDNQGGDNTQTGDNSDNAGSDNGSDSSDSSNGGDSADAGQGDTGSDSSNAEDSMDAGQGDTNSDSSNAGDSTDAGQGDTNSDSSNAEDTADAVSGEDAAQSEENTGDTGVLGVSRPRTAVDMSYQSEPVGAEAVDVTEGDATNTGDTQEKQVITFTRTVHVVAASEDEVPVYEARELVLIQGEEDYDLTDDILYDDVKYTLTVGDLGGFDIQVIGSYEVTYSLTPVTTEGTQENGQDDTQENQVITFQRTVTVKAAVEENALYEAPDLYLEWGQEEYDLTEGIIYDKDLYEVKVSDPGDFDIYTLGEYEVTYVLDRLGKSAKAEDTQTSKTEETTASNEDTDNAQTATLELTDEKQSVDPADGDITNSTEEKTSEVKTASQEAVYFTRNVIVEEAGVTYSFRNAVSYANVQGKYTIKLGTPVWTDETHTKFQYTNAKIDTENEDINLMTITLSNGKLPDDILKDANIRDNEGKSATWIFINGKSCHEIEKKMQTMTFDYANNMNVYVSVNGNDNEGFGSNLNEMKLTQWPDNGHYYLYVKKKLSWTNAYKEAKKFRLGGMRGYLTTIASNKEAKYLVALDSKATWTAGTRLVKKNGSLINDDTFGIVKDGLFKYSNNYYWAAGPERRTKIGTGLWSTNEPNSMVPNYDVFDRTLSSVQGAETCVMVTASNQKLNDIVEGNTYKDTWHTMYGFFVEFGGYADGADPGHPDSSKKGETKVLAAPMDAEASINGVKYAPLADALELSKAGDEVQIIKQNVTKVTDGMLKTEVKLISYDGNTTYTGKQDSKVDVAGDGTVTLKDGKLELSAQASLKVFNPTDGQTYQVTTPNCTSWVTVDKNGGFPYFMGETNGDVQIGAVTYTYQNPGQGQFTHVNIPQGMKNNDKVKKAEVAADQSVTIEVDDTNSVVLNGGGNTGDTVTVERRTGNDSKVDVKLPSSAQGTIFGYDVGAAPTGGVTVSQRSAENAGYPNRDYITIADAGNEVVVDGFRYRATSANQKFYLGTFQVNTIFGAHAGVKGTKPADPHYLEEYTITICPDKDYDLDKDNFVLTMKENDTADAKNLAFATYCTEEADGSIKVRIPKVTGDITIYAEAKKQTSKLIINGLDGRGIVKVLDGEGQVHELKQGNDSITVNRNEELTLTFIPDDFTESYYGDLTGEKGSSFSILTGLKDNTLGAAGTDLFTQDVKNSFDWTEKSYQVKYTPNKAENTLEATFTHSSIMHVHVTGGTAEVNTTVLEQNPTDSGSFRHVIVPDNTQVQVTLKDTTGHNPVYKTAYWKQTSAAGGNDMGTEVSSQLNDAGSKTYTYTTQAVSASHMLNVSFEQGQNVDVTFTGGNALLVQTGTTWTEQGNHTYRTLVKNGNTLTLKVQAKEGYGLKSITVNGFSINVTEALKNPEYNVTYDETTRIYTHTTKPIDQAWNVVMDFEEKYTVSFEDQQGRTLETIPAVNGTTIPEEKFTEMQAKTDALKEGNEIFLTWVDKADENTAYNKNTIITKNNLVLKPVYRKNAGNGGHIENGSDGSILAADDFAVHLRDLHNLTVDNVKDEKYANVTAFDKGGAKMTAQVTVDADELAALKTKSAGTYRNALTFTYNNLSVKVTVEISDAEVTITGRTAHTLTFTGKGGVTYQVQKSDEAGGSLTGNVMSAATAAGTGKGTADGLDKAAYYLISHKAYGQAVGRTSLVDAKDIAKQFEDRGAGDTKGNNATDRTEKAENSNVQVVVDDDGNYKVIVKKDIDRTVEIPDTWGEVKIDLGGHTITGDKADDNHVAKPGLDFVKDGSINEHPGTKLEIVNGTIKGGDGSAKHPDGAPGIGASGDTADAGLIIGNDAKVIGGNGANGTEGKDGGNGGAGIDGNGKITPTVNGTVTGGNGGKGGDSATGIPGNGGNGGTGISAGDKTITIHPGGTVKGGDAGSGGSATGGNTNPGGNGGNGGTGTETTQPGKTDNNGGTTSGGNGGDGGKSDNGNGGNGGNGGSGSTGENNNNGGTSSGGNGGNGGDSDKGNGGSGGNGGSSGETGGNGGNNSGGNGGNGGDSNSGNGGSGGNGGDSNSGTGGNGGNGGDSNNGTGGNGGNGGNSNNGNGGNGGNGGDSNSGNNGNGGSSGSNGNRPGGNGGGSNNGNGGNGGNNGGDNSGNNSGNNSGDNGGNNGGDNSNTNGNNNSGSTGNTGNTPDAGNTAGNDSGNNAHKGNKGNSTGNSNAGQKDPAEDDSLNDAADESSLTGDADGSDADGSDADGIQEEESIHADSDSVENGTDSDSHIPFGECGFHWIPIVWLLVILGYTVVRVKKLRDESEEA